EEGATASVSGTTFSRNSAGADGGGIANFGSADVSGSTFTRNSAAVDGGGIANESGGTASVVGSTFTRNSAGADGGGIFNGGTLVQSDNTFTRNDPNDISP